MDYIQTLRENLNLEDNSGLHPAAVLALLTREKQPKLLLTRRSETLNTHAGEVSLPGGRREFFERSNATAALRETHEEVGIHPEAVELIGSLPAVKARSGASVKPLVGLVAPTPKLILQEREVAKAFWVPLNELIEAKVTPYRVRYRGVPLKTASFLLQEEVVWGLTGRVLVQLLEHGLKESRKWPQIMPPWT